ncbi:hypothetical protein JVU11DRAFT_8846 [Chiua virens]|nr:hypothetical protein JVU11DRAFT_8846 [Chiua virens]
MSFIRDQMSFTTTRMKSIIPNRLPFRHSFKATDVNESAISEHIKTEHGHGITPSNTVNIVLFGETGVGKSSVINLIAQRTLAKVSSDVNGCTMESTKHDIEFDGMKFAIFDTIGLEEPQMGVNGYLKAIEKAYELITKLNHAGGVHLLLFCMRGGRITATTQSNYRLFCEILCSTKVPTALVFTGLEREVEMEDWWRRNQKHIEGYGIKSDGHACVTAVLDNDTPGEDLKYNESRVVIRDLLKTCALKNTAYSPDTFNWFARLGREMMGLIEKRMSPKRKKVLKVLVKRCKLDPETAKKIADMMEKGDPNTQPAQSGAVGEVNPPDPGPPVAGPEEGGGNGDAVPSADSEDDNSDDEGEDSRPSENRVVPSTLGTSFSGKTTETGQQTQDGNKEEESHSNMESNASGRQKTKHANVYVETPSPDDADRAGTTVHVRAKPSDNPRNPDTVDRAADSPIRRSSKRLGGESGSRTTSSRSVRDDTRPSREYPSSYATSAISHPSIGESTRPTKEEPIPEGAGRVSSSPSVGESIRITKEEPIPEGADRTVPFPSVREGIRRSKEEPIPDGASRGTPSPNVREGIRPSRKEPHADTVPYATPYTTIGETQAAVQPKRVPSPASGDKWSAVSSGGSPGQTKKVSNPDSGASSWSATGSLSGQLKRGPNLEVASQSGSRVGAGGSAGQPRNAASIVQPDPNAVVPPQTYTGRGGYTGQSSSHRYGATS